jgi:hypothetical protein
MAPSSPDRALWVGYGGATLGDGTQLIPHETICDVPLAEAEASDHWQPVDKPAKRAARAPRAPRAPKAPKGKAKAKAAAPAEPPAPPVNETVHPPVEQAVTTDGDS